MISLKKRLLLLTVLALFLSLSLFILKRDAEKTETNFSHTPGEESKARLLWEFNRLADPLTGKIPEGIRLKELATYREILKPAALASKNSRGASWRFRGPWNVGGRTRSMAIDRNDENHLIAGGVSGGLWGSIDAGKTWSRLSAPLDHPGVVSIAQDPRPGRENMWYALSGELYGTSASGGSAFYLGDGAMFSIDHGITWNPIESTAAGVPGSFTTSFQGGWKIECSPADTTKTNIYMATYGSIFRSTDTGKTWKAVLGAGNDSYFTDLAITSSGIVYAALSSDGGIRGFYRSADGVNFTNITPSQLKSYNRTVIEINVNNENEVYFLSELPSDTSGGVATSNYEGDPEWVSLFKYTYVSGDGSGTGGQWTNLSINLPVSSAAPFDKFNVQSGYDLMVRTQKASNAVYIGGTNLYRSLDGFTTPQQITQIGGYALSTTLPNFGVYPEHHPDQHNLYFLKNSQQAWSVSDGGVRFTENIYATPVVWQDRSHGYITSQFYSIAIDESKAYDQWMLGGLQDNGNYISYSNNPQHLWKMTINGDGSYNYIAPNREYFIISTQLGNVRKVSLDRAGKVMKAKRIDPSGYDKSLYNFINQLTVDPSGNHTLFMAIGKRMARLNDVRNIQVIDDNNKLNSGWTVSSDTIRSKPTTSGSAAEITALAYAPSHPDILYCGTNNRQLYVIKNARKGALVFDSLSVNRLPGNGYVSGIAVDPDSAGSVLICYSNYGITSLYYTRDTGRNWFFVGGNLELSTYNNTGAQSSVRCVAILPQADGKRIYFAGTSVGLYSTDSLVLATSTGLNKTTWVQESPDLIGANIVTDIRVRRVDGYVAAATHGGGVFESYYTGNTVPASQNILAGVSVYPNPARDIINFDFDAESGKLVSAEIWDVRGRRITRLFSDKYRTGKFTVQYPCGDLPAGMYFLVYNKGDQKKPVVQSFVIGQ